ncbi:MAG: LptF/LptG family permease [Candidatus Gastranaerophilales bacterium]|nr:LptF/LptG family permease [Candidatus Gastranaerophilales bacterium]
MRIKLLDKYLFKQVILAGAVCVLLFMVIWIAPELLLRTIQRVLAGVYTLKMGVQIITFEIPKILDNALPVGLLLGALFTFDKMSKDFELTTFRSVGLSFWRILAPVIVLSILVMGFSFFVQDTLIPFTSQRLNVIKEENESSHFVYPIKSDEEQMEKIVIVSTFDNNYIHDITVLDFSKNEDEGASILNTISIGGYANYSQGKWILKDAKKYKVAENGVFTDVSRLDNVEILSGQRADDAYKLMKYSVKRDRDLSNAEMFNYILLLKNSNMDDEFRFMLNKFLQRYTHSFMCVLFAILGCLLGFSKPREQRLVGFTIAVATIFLYYITMPFFDLLAEKGILNPVLTAFIPPVAVLVAIIWFKKQKDL